MKIKSYILIIVLLFCMAFQGIAQSDDGIVQGVIRIKVKPELVAGKTELKAIYSKGQLTTGIKALDNLNASVNATEMHRVFRYSPAYEERHKKHSLHLWYEITVSSKATAQELVQKYSQLGEVSLAEPVYEPVLLDGKYTPAKLKSNKNVNSLPFNDPGLVDQWHYNNTGQTGGTPGMDINLFNAWNITTGNTNVIVAVMDQGVDYTHEDLAANMYTNLAEKNGILGKDDDGNGYIDDVHGFNFCSNYGDPDKGEHGTHVSGTIAAINNNGVGVCGIAGGNGNGNNAKIMSCEIIGGSGRANYAEAYVFAADNGAIISQNSWGFTSGNGGEALYDAMDYFIAEAGNFPGSLMKGGVIIFASGNSNTNYPMWPGAYEKVIAVNSLGADGQKANYSNYGCWTDISAPGGSSSVNRKQGVLSTVPGNKYAYMDGTSMACPHVSGVAALIVSKFGTNNFYAYELKNRLLTGIRKDIYAVAANASYIDSLGVGITDAALALATDNKIAPATINDFKLESISQDFANVSWTVPTDADDVKPLSFNILWSVDPDFVFAKSVKIQNNSNIGEKINYEISGLDALTTYYFAVQAIDRWGNVSENSNVETGTTNSGPVTVVNPTTVPLIKIQVNTSTSGTSTFNVSNTGEGTLKYSLTQFHKSNTDKYNFVDISYPRFNPVSKKYTLGSEPVENIETITPFAQIAYNPVLVKAHGAETARYIIGEMDTTYTNSAAIRYFVSETEGFNLTHIRAWLKLDRSRGNAIIEIYNGKDISTAKKVYAQSYLVSTGYNLKSMSHEIQLIDQLYFESGTYFWIVIHTPSGHLYPLGTSLENATGLNTNCYYSGNMGKVWNTLTDVFWDDELVWTISAVSKLAPLGKYITINPTSGVLASGNNTNILLNVDASKLINGTYYEEIILYTNQQNKPIIQIPYSIQVDNQQPKITLPEIVDFGSVMVGTEKTIDIVIPNTGLGKLKSMSALTYSNNTLLQFSTVTKPTDIVAMGSGTLTIKFKPVTAGVGPINSIVTFTAKDQNVNAAGASAQNITTYTFMLTAVAVAPPVQSVTPPTTTYSNVALGTTVNGSVTLQNSGAYPLKYYVPGKAISNLTGESKYTHKYGYTVNLTGTYNWTDISASGTNITSLIQNPSYRSSFYQVPLNMNFPFFGKGEDSIYISRGGILAFDLAGHFNRIPYSYKDGDNGWGYVNPIRSITALGCLNTDYSQGGTVYYQHFVDKFIVQYDNIALQYYSGLISFQIVLFDNGDIHYYYKSNTISAASLKGNTIIDIEDLSIDDALPIHINTSTALPYYNTLPATGSTTAYIISCPGKGIISTVDKPSGVIAASGSTTINYTINTTSLAEGNYIQKLNFATNDPINPIGTHLIDLSITSGGIANAALSANSLDFGSVPQGGVKKMKFEIRNTGTKNITITSATFDNSNYTITESYTDLKVGRILPFFVQINSAVIGNNLTAVLTITTDEPNTYTVNLTGNIIEPAYISSDITTINETIVSGTTKDLQIVVSNTGTNTLEYTPTGNQWIQVDHSTIASNSTSMDYVMTKSTATTNAPIYKWVDIVFSGTDVTPELDPIIDGEKSWTTIDLPWEFEFYGEKHNKIYINMRGIIAFNKFDPNSIAFGPGADAPNTNEPNNYIAPLYCFGGPSDSGLPFDYPNPGIFYQAFDDMIVIQFNQMYNNFGMGNPMTGEAILYKDGSIKFQYKTTDPSHLNWTQAAIENQDGTKGAQVSNKSENYITPKLAVLFTPVKTHTIAAGATETLNVKLSAVGLNAGTYTGKIMMNNNTPDKSTYQIPATLTVQGTPVYTVSNSDFAFGELVTYKYYSQAFLGNVWKEYNKPCVVKNTGSSAMTISTLSVATETPKQITNIQAWLPERDWFGNLTGKYVWTDLPNSYFTLPYTIAPGDSLAMKVVLFSPTLTSSYTGPFGGISINNTLSIAGNFAGSPLSYPITANLKSQPIVGLDRETINITTNDPAFTSTEVVKIINNQIAGQLDLNYNLSMEYTRSSVQTTAASYSVQKNANNTGKAKISALPVKAITTKNIASKSYNRVLEYNTVDATSSIGYGGEEVMGSATAFVAPANGFNLTHVMTWYTPGTSLKSRIWVEIRAGSTTPDNAQIVYSGSYDTECTSPDNDGSYHTIKLNQNVLLFPNETFYVIFYYPLQSDYPQGVVTGNSVANRYYFLLYNPDGSSRWADMTSFASLANYNHQVKAMEETFQSNGWIVLPSTTSGTITSGSNFNAIDLGINAAYANQGMNKAKMVISSNDPLTAAKNVYINLYLNQAPKFTGGNVINLSVNENSSIKHKVTIADVEKNTFTIEVGTLDRMVSTTGSNFAEFTYSPNYDDAGVKTFHIVTTDQYNASANMTVNITVNNVNRAPLAQTVADKTAYLNAGYFRVPFSTVFTDPDGDAMTYAVTVSDANVVDVAVGNDSYYFYPLTTGNSVITMKAADNSMAETSLSFNLIVNDNHAPVVAQAITDQVIYLNSPDKTIDLTPVFSDVDNNTLTYTVNSSNTNVATAAIENTNLKITGKVQGVAIISVTAKDPLGLEATSYFIVSVNTSTGMAEITETYDFRVYPNPAVSVATFEINLPVPATVVLVITDVNGKIVGNVVNNNKMTGNQKIEFDVTSLSSGVYTYQFVVNGKRTNSEKLVRQ